ncbi:hypothetical protein B0J12DRAFT_771672 [Macrophomina phaseolina]|uniref:Flavin-containing monooxygenase-like protein n=1 Tax=Macrophomina phaseolina TaxID=35725 RepID=A0ABQ8FTP3_9PEZI|nr:hypothetical protein B0J12DRAFT_771672 [Macrophomina phaseolina]
MALGGNLNDLPYGEASPIMADYGHYPAFDAKQRPIHVLVAGMGISGIALAIELKKRPNITFEIFEKNADVGGTWFENTYPGVACDLASHVYQYTFAWNPNWTSRFAPGHEIRKYYSDVATKFDVRRFAHFNTRVNSATWDEVSGKWTVLVTGKGDEAPRAVKGDVFVNAGGVLNNWRWPDIEGLHDFRGTLLHTANWNESPEFEGKTVAVIGSGASGVQILPQVQPKAAHVLQFVRTPTYLLPFVGFGPEHEKWNEPYSEEHKQRLRTDPEYYLQFRKTLEKEHHGFAVMRRDSKEQKEARKVVTEAMRKILKSKDLQDKLIPNFEFWCNRPSPGLLFLEAVQKENVEVLTTSITRFVPEGIQTADGQVHHVDAIICATGFDVSFRPHYDIIGQDGLNLSQLWKQKSAEGYLGVSVAGFPNYFSLLGPNSPIGNGSVTATIEYLSKYICQALEKMQHDQIKSMRVKRSVEVAFNGYAQAVHKDLVWTGDCKSFYKGKDGRIVAMWPGAGSHYLHAIEKPRFEDYEIDYIHGHPFVFLGDGSTQREVSGEDMTWYLKECQYL